MKDVVGPHVIVKTDDEVSVVGNGRHPKWRCKYCGNTGTHPDDPPHNMGWVDDCGDFSVLESERVLLR